MKRISLQTEHGVDAVKVTKKRSEMGSALTALATIGPRNRSCEAFVFSA